MEQLHNIKLLYQLEEDLVFLLHGSPDMIKVHVMVPEKFPREVISCSEEIEVGRDTQNW